MAEQQVTAGTTLYNEGDAAESAYIVQSGTVEVFKLGEGKEIKIAEYTEGEMFGETGIFDANAPHVNTARAKTDATVDAITFAELTALVEQSPPRLIPIISSVFERLATLTQRPQQKAQQVQAVLDVDAEKVRISGANDTTQNIAAKELALHHLPLRIGGYHKNGEPERNHGNHVIIPCDGPPLVVSAHHCEIIAEDGALYLRDAGSRFGTTVNGQTIGQGKGVYKSPLRKGDNSVILGDKKTSPYHITVSVA